MIKISNIFSIVKTLGDFSAWQKEQPQWAKNPARRIIYLAEDAEEPLTMLKTKNVQVVVSAKQQKWEIIAGKENIMALLKEHQLEKDIV